MSDYKEKSEFLIGKGWYTYYNRKFWMHPLIENSANGTDLGFFILETDEAVIKQNKWDELEPKEPAQ